MRLTARRRQYRRVWNRKWRPSMDQGPAPDLESALSWPLFSPRSVLHCATRAGNLAGRLFGDFTMGYKVAVVGATGNVGRQMMEILAERSFPADEVVALASRRSLGSEVSYGDATLKCKA